MALKPKDTQATLPQMSKVSDEELLALRPLKPRKKATFDSPTPSNYCHICSRTPNRGIRLAVCSGLQQGKCRKVICERCFAEYPLGCTFDHASDASQEWKCTHCQEICPQRAQCRTYQSVNRKLRLQRLRQSVVTDVTLETKPKETMRSSLPDKIPPAQSQHQFIELSNQRQVAEPVLPPLKIPSHSNQFPMFQSVQTNHRKMKGEPIIDAARKIGGSKQMVSPSSVAQTGTNFTSAKKMPCGAVTVPGTNIAGYTAASTVASAVQQRCHNRSEMAPPFNPDSARRKLINTAGGGSCSVQQSTDSSAPSDSTNDQGPECAHRATCHICHRKIDEEGVTCFKNCAAVSNPNCRAAFCNLCFESEGALVTGISAAESKASRWECCHCTDSCPENSSCKPVQAAERAFDTQGHGPRIVTSMKRRRKDASLKSRLLAATERLQD